MNTISMFIALLEKQHAPDVLFDVSLGVAASSGPARKLTLDRDELAAVLAARLNYDKYYNVQDWTLAVFEPAAYDWITYEKLEKENAE